MGSWWGLGRLRQDVGLPLGDHGGLSVPFASDNKMYFLELQREGAA